MPDAADRSWHVFLAGQALIRFDIRDHFDEFFPQLLGLARDAEVFFSNLEVAIRSPLGGQQAKWTEYFMAGDPVVLDNLKALGVNLLALSNNHSYDMGRAGVLATREEVRRRGFAYAGAGADVAEATAPGYLETARGTVALVAMASGGLDPEAPATHARAGINELRVGEDGTLHPDDLDRNLAAIRTATAQAGYVLVYQHSHYWEPDWQETPEWQRLLARLCIEAGAATFVGHGPPLLQGVELYQGRPILYSLGNFIFQLQPDENFGHPICWESVVADARFQDGTLTALRFYPIVLNRQTPSGQVAATTGLPKLARGQTAHRILQRLAQLSNRLETKIYIADGYAELKF